MALTRGYNLKLEYIPETQRGREPWIADDLQTPGDAIDNYTLTGTNNGEIVYTMSSFEGQDFVPGLEEYTMTFDYYVQRLNNEKHPLDLSLPYFATTRDTNTKDLTPLTFYLTTQGGTGDESGCTWTLTGGVINSYGISGNAGERVKASVEVVFSGCTTVTGLYSTHSSSSAWDTTYETFQGAGITRSGSFEEGVNNWNFTVNNNAGRFPKIGSSTPTVYEGHENVEGSVDILLVNGGKSDWNEMVSATQQSITFDTGDSTTDTDQSMTWTFADASYGEVAINAGADSVIVQSGVPWKAKTVSVVAKA